MKFALIPLFNLLCAIPTFALGVQPVPNAIRAAENAKATFLPTVSEAATGLVKRDNAAVVKVEGLGYRKCPRIAHDCPIEGRYHKGQHITLHCYTRENTSPVKCDLGWGKVAGCDFWVPLAWGQDVAWEGGLPYC